MRSAIAIALVLLVSLCSSVCAASLQLSVEPAESYAGNHVLVYATLTNNSIPLPNKAVNFSIISGVGTLSGSSALTNARGIASVYLYSTQSGNSELSSDYMGTVSETNVMYFPDTVSSINLDTSASSLTVGENSTVNITASDKFGNTNTTANFIVNMTILDVKGRPRNTSIYSTYPGNQLYINISYDKDNDDVHIDPPRITPTGESFTGIKVNSTYSCSIIFNVSSETVLNSTVLEYSAGKPYRISVIYDDEHTVNTTSTIWTTVYDSFDNPVINRIVSFEVTPPKNTSYNSPITYNSATVSPASGNTDLDGRTYTIFRTDKRAGTNTINISVGTTLKKSVKVKGLADKIQSMLLSSTPSNCYANNEDYYRLSARPVDQFSNPMLPAAGSSIKEQVYFVGLNSGSTLIPLNELGIATTKVGPTPYIENISVTATYKNESGLTTISSATELGFIRGKPAKLWMYAYPSKVLTQNQTGNHNATIVGAVLDSWGHTLSDINVMLNNTNTSLGTIYIGNQSGTTLNTTTDAEGRISATFVSKDLGGNCSLILSNGSINTTSDVKVSSSPFITAYVRSEPNEVASGDIVNVTAVVKVDGELPVVRDAATAMLVLDRSGSMDPDSYAGTPLDVVLVIDRSGSMGPKHYNTMLDAKEAAKNFASNLVSNSQLGVVSFAWEPYVASSIDLDLTPLNSSANLLLVNKSIDKLHAVGGTAMGEGMADANDMLINDGRLDSRKVMIVLTDGETNSGTDQEGSEAVELANANGITIYTIGLETEINEALLRSIASETDGKYYSASNGSVLKSIYNSIAQDICDYDITDIEYGGEGFTPYSYTFSDSISIEDTYTLSFKGYDFDDVFDASPYYGGTSAGECLIKVNGDNLGLLPSVRTTSNSGSWRSFNYDITDYVHSGENSLSFYDYYDYTGYRDYYDYYGYYYWWSYYIGNNRVKNVVVKHNGNTIQSYSADTPLDGTGYVLSFDAPLSTDYFEDTFAINESLDDLKVELQWEHDDANLYLQLISPSGKIYGTGYDTTGYYSADDGRSEYIWINPLSDFYPDDEGDTVETGNWTVRVTGTSTSGSGTGQEDFTILTYIDKKSATRIASSAFLTSFDETKGDQAGLVLYSEDSINSTPTQSSYVRSGSQWVGYFTVDSRATYTFNLAWTDASVMDLKLYEGIDVLDSTSGGSSPIGVSSILEAGTDYRLVVEKTAGDINDSAFSIDVSATPASEDSAILVYTDTDSESVPRYRSWDGSSWSAEQSAEYVGGDITHLVLESSPQSNEFILGSLDDWQGANFQVYNDGWGGVEEFSSSMNSYGRGFDIAYEQDSGDGLIVYGYWSWSWGGWKRTWVDSVSYRTWDGNGWSSDSEVDDIRAYWITLESAPDSDEIMIVTLDNSQDINARVWDGESWGNSNVITNDACTYNYQCYDVAYEQQSGDAIVVWADSDTVHYKIWDGTSWESEGDIYSFNPSQNVYWIKVAADPNSNDILLVMGDKKNNIRITTWDGSSWSATMEIEDDAPDNSIRSFDVAFESETGTGMVVWSDDTPVPKYRLWDGSSWGSELSASGVSDDVRWVKLESDPDSDSVFLITSDDGGSYPDINVQQWDGSSWGVPDEVETSSGSSYENFDLAFTHIDPDPVTPQINWNLWSARVASDLENDSLSHLENTVNTMTCEGLTAIDEGLYEGNNVLEAIQGNTTMVLMTDGIDNAGSHSLLEQAQRAKQHNTVIYTVGFGDNEAEIDPVLRQVASITGGEYYFAPNSTVLESIFTGIASKITNFTADGPTLSIHIPHSYVTNLSTTTATATYISNSSNSTTGNGTLLEPTSPSTANAEPEIITSGDRDMLEWVLPNMGPGDWWGVWYQLKVDGSGWVPLVLSTSSLNYTDVNGTTIDVDVSTNKPSTEVTSGAPVPISSRPVKITIEPSSDVVDVDQKMTFLITILDEFGGYADANTSLHIYTDLGVLSPDSMNNISGPTTISFSSTNAGWAHLRVTANNKKSSATGYSSIFVRPRGQITIS